MGTTITPRGLNKHLDEIVIVRGYDCRLVKGKLKFDRDYAEYSVEGREVVQWVRPMRATRILKDGIDIRIGNRWYIAEGLRNLKEWNLMKCGYLVGKF